MLYTRKGSQISEILHLKTGLILYITLFPQRSQTPREICGLGESLLISSTFPGTVLNLLLQFQSLRCSLLLITQVHRNPSRLKTRQFFISNVPISFVLFFTFALPNFPKERFIPILFYILRSELHLNPLQLPFHTYSYIKLFLQRLLMIF